MDTKTWVIIWRFSLKKLVCRAAAFISRYIIQLGESKETHGRYTRNKWEYRYNKAYKVTCEQLKKKCFWEIYPYARAGRSK